METHEGRRNSVVRGVKEFQIEGSWAPMTPLNPSLTRPRPIYEQGRGGGEGEGDLSHTLFLREYDDQISRFSHHQNQSQTQNNNHTHYWENVLHSNSNNYYNNNDNNPLVGRPIFERENVGMQTNWSSQGRRLVPQFCNANLGQSNFPIYDSSWEFSNSNDNGVRGNGTVVGNNFEESLSQFNSMSFGDLLAMNGSLVEQPTNFSMALGNSCGSTTNDVFRGGLAMNSMRVGSSGAMSTNDFFQGGLDCTSTFRGVNLQIDGLAAGEMQSSAFQYQNGSLCNVHSSPRTNHTNGNMFSFAPPTPDLQQRADNVLTTGITNEQNNTEVMAGARDSLLDKGSIVIEENHNSDKVGEQGIDLNKTPAQKKTRRRRYTPKVVREGKPKKTPKSTTPKPPKDLSETPKVKRKYVWKNNKSNPPLTTPPPGETTESIDPKSTEPLVKASCKRSLNFDLNEQEIEGSYANPYPKESTIETSEVGVACDLNRTLFQEPTNYGPNSSPCASSNQGVQMRGSKRVCYSSITDVIEGNFGNVVPTLLGNVNIDGVPENLNPEIRERTEDLSQASSSVDHLRADLGASKYYYCNPVPFEGNTSAHNQAAILLRNAQNRAQLLNTWADISRLKKKKHSVGKTRVCELKPITTAIPPAKWARMTGMNPPNGVNSCVEALTGEAHTAPPSKRGPKKNISARANRQLDLVLYDGNRPARKKKGKRNSKNKVYLRWISTISLEAITEGLKQLDINRKDSKMTRREQNAIVPYQMNNQEKNALVLYKQDRTMVPYEGPFEPIRKRRQRAKVELDDETTRVWRLLLENIDNQGIDGTDEDKVKWWDNERCVFNGRVDSFIARMRLVQGDRRFTPWKGSVLDSVIGVFLTQNVSDHLSSSAFMTMVARYPLKLEHDEGTLSEEATSALVVEPEVYIVEPEESITWNEKALDRSEEKEVDYYGESSQKPTNNESRVNKANSPTTDTEGGSIVGDDKARDDATSSQQSVISSQNSVSSANFQATGGIVGSVSETNCNYFDGPSPTSFMGLLKMAESPLLHESCSRFPGNFGKDFPEASSDYQYFHLQASKYIEMPEAESRSSDMSRKGENSPTKESNLTESVVQDLGNEKYLNDVPRSFVLDGEQRIVHLKTQGQTSSIWKSTTNLPNSAKETNVTESITAEIEHILKQSDANPSPRKPSSNSRPGKAKKEAFDWDSLRREARDNGRIKERTANTRDSIDWERVRRTHVSEIADTIKARGMNNMLSERIKELLDRLVRDHGSIDLEWIRYIPPDKAKEYLLSFRGLGLKSVECVRLLTLHHLAFPVDTNVGRIAVRLGWVPLQPLPESLQLHLLEMYPILESIQKYLWPRLCKLDQKTLYELHYHMITFGKVFCTKRQPNCNACPLRGECRHFASAFASARLALPGPEERSIVASNGGTSSNIHPQPNFNPLALPAFWGNQHSGENPRCHTGRSIVEVRSTPLSLPFPQTIQHLERKSFFDHCEPIVEVPASPEPEPEPTFCDIEDAFYEDPDEIPTIELNMKQFTHTLENFMQANRELTEAGISKAMVALTAEAASIPTPKLKNINRLRTEHHVYELPDTHPLLKEMDKREHDDPCSYLLAIWTPGETAESIDPPERRCNFEDPNILCNEVTCAYCSSQLEANNQIVRGTLLIPCRTAMRGSFPLNGTYFQVNEVFADHDSSLSPIEVPRTWLWNLPRRTVYFGTSIPSIFKGLNTEEIQHCFWRGYVCVRGFDQKTRAPRPLMARLHFPASRMAKGNNGKPYRDDE